MKNKFLSIFFILLFPLSTFANGFGDYGSFSLTTAFNQLIDLLSGKARGNSKRK